MSDKVLFSREVTVWEKKYLQNRKTTVNSSQITKERKSDLCSYEKFNRLEILENDLELN